MSKLWGGRFGKETAKEVDEFSSSLSVDRRLALADIRGSIAHARMLGQVGVIPALEAAQIVTALEALRTEFLGGKITLDESAEDIHSEVERLLGEKVGVVAGKLHTGRSRNDQVATATRLYLRDEVDLMMGTIRTLQKTLIAISKNHVNTVLPGLTHVQHAQPVSLAHHLMAYFWMLERDHGRLHDARKRLNVMPLGSAALAGTSYPLDRQMTAAELGFTMPSQNSMDAVSDRDFVIEFLASCSLIMTHLSRLSEELIYWSAPEFGFVELDDSVTTGSSIMPQKKNPDVAELIRGKTGRATGALMGTLTLLKGLPLSYNRDLQEDKFFLFDGLDTAMASLKLMNLMLESADFKTERMRDALKGDFSNATDLADYLVKKGMPFRQSHEVVGKIVRHCLSEHIALENISVVDLKRFSPLFEADMLPLLQHDAVMAARNTFGGTAPARVREQIALAEQLLH